MKKLITAKACSLFLNGNGYGYGDGNGYGYGNGNGDGNFQMPHPYYMVDGIWCEFLSIHGNYAKVNMIDIYHVENCKSAYIAKNGNQFAHGETLREARESLIYKVGDRDTKQYKDWKLDDVKTAKELIPAYRAITGACEYGTKHFCSSIQMPKKCSIRQAIELTRGQYGSDKFKAFFEK